MRLIVAFINLYLSISYIDAKGLTMITRGCIGNYLRQNQLLNDTLKIGPVPSMTVCNNIVRKVKKSLINNVIKSQMRLSEESETDDVKTYKVCFEKLIDEYDMTDVLLKNFMYQEEEFENKEQMETLTNSVLDLYDYLCHPNELRDDFNKRFTYSFAGYEKEVNRYCLVTLLLEKEIINQEFNINFETLDATSVKCPTYINEDIFYVKTEAFDLIHQTDLYKDEIIWECAAEERIKLGYVRAYYRFMAYTFSHESDSRKSDERQRFLQALYSANKFASKCFKIGYEII